MATFVLIHAPLAGPVTWSLVADKLRSRSHDVIVPSLPDAAEASPPYWPRYAAAVGHSLKKLPAERSLILVAHSGAGLLLPLVRQTTGRPVEAYVFVDAMVPQDGMLPDEESYFRRIAVDGFIPPFSEAVLRTVGIDDDSIRGRLLSELRPLPLGVYEEPTPVFKDWPDASCGYLRFTRTLPTAYERFVQRARRQGWAYREVDGNHFHMLVDPKVVVTALLDLVGLSSSD